MENIVASSFPWLTLLVALPALDVLLLAVIPGLRKTANKGFALAVSLFELTSAIGTALSFGWIQSGSYQLLKSHPWIAQMDVTWSLGASALGLMMILLAIALVPLALLVRWNEDENEAEAGVYTALVLFLEMFMIVVFAAFNLVVFYIAFKAMLIPLFFMIRRYGVGEAQVRRAAVMELLFYSLVGGLVMLGGVIALWTFAPRHSVAFFRLDQPAAASSMLPATMQMDAFISFMIAFTIKAPMVPLHAWLPDTAAVSRPGTSVLLVGVLNKIGTFGMIALCLRLFLEAADQVKWMLYTLTALPIIWGGLAASGQDDIMHFVSYASVSRFDFIVLDIFIGSEVTLVGAIFCMVAHGVSIAAMFLLSGWLTRHGGTQDIREYGGMQHIAPYPAGLWLASGLASIAPPGLSGFVPECFVLMRTWKVSVVFACFAVLSVIIATVYVLMSYQRVFTGEPVKDKNALSDLDLREESVMAPLVVAMLILGMYSAPLVGALTPIASDSALGDTLSTMAQTLLEGSSK